MDADLPITSNSAHCALHQSRSSTPCPPSGARLAKRTADHSACFFSFPLSFQKPLLGRTTGMTAQTQHQMPPSNVEQPLRSLVAMCVENWVWGGGDSRDSKNPVKPHIVDVHPKNTGPKSSAKGPRLPQYPLPEPVSAACRQLSRPTAGKGHILTHSWIGRVEV